MRAEVNILLTRLGSHDRNIVAGLGFIQEEVGLGDESKGVFCMPVCRKIILQKYNTVMNNNDIAIIFEHIADLLEIKGEIIYKVAGLPARR